MTRVGVPRVAAIAFVALVGSVIALNAAALDRQRSSTTAMAVAGRQQVLAASYLQEVLLRERGLPADPRATMEELTSAQDALLAGGQVKALQGSPDDVITISRMTNPRVRAKLLGESTLVRRLRAEGEEFLRLAANDPRRPAQLLKLRVTTALLWSTTRDVVGEMTRQAKSAVDRLVGLEIALGAVGTAAALGMGAIFGRSAKSGAAAKFRSLVTHASDLVLTTDGDGTITYASPSALSVLGYRPATLIGKPAADLVHPDDLALLVAELTTILDEPGRSTSMACRANHADGRWIQIEATCTNLLSEPTVRGIVLNGRDVTDHNRMVEELAHKAFHDDLTGLANRALLRDRLEHALARSHRSAATVSLLFCDLDGFKMINDSLGHNAGNQLLVEVAKRIEGKVREGDTAARLGGDEFAVLLDDSAPGDAIALASRILDALREPFTITDRELYVRASVGIAENSAGGLDADRLLIHADIAMYAAKARGRDRYEMFQDAMQSELTTYQEVHEDLRRALDRHELVVHYQPLVDLATGHIDSFEALLRWNHPTRGMVTPAVFIPIAEESGLILPIGRFVLQEACRQAAEWRNAFPAHADLSISVNVGSAQIQDIEFATDVERTLTETGLAGEHLVLELTESTLLSDTSFVQARLGALKDLGVQLAIDDFGTGYSSLSYLHAFPVDYLKIDQSFVKELTRERNEQASVMVRSIIGLGQNLNLRIIAEGIEEPAQLDELRAAGCDIGQGYLFGRPGLPDEMGAFLAQDFDLPTERIAGPLRRHPGGTNCDKVGGLEAPAATVTAAME